MKWLHFHRTIKGKILLENFLVVFAALIFVTIYNYINSVNIIKDKTAYQMNVVGRVYNAQFDKFFEEIVVISDNIMTNNSI